MGVSKKVWHAALMSLDSNIGDVINNLNQSGIKIVMVVNQSGVLQGTISDGDLRQALLGNWNIKSPITDTINQNPLVVPPDMEKEFVKKIMLANKVQQIPVVNVDNKIVGLHVWDEFVNLKELPNLMVIMAGGKGTRLRPHTENCPKPMLPVAGKPMLEIIIERAKSEGFSRFVISVHFLGKVIESYFGNGESLGVSIDYLREEEPMGTAGALSMLDPLPIQPIVVTNGDVLSNINYKNLLDFHSQNSALATMAVHTHELQHPFGVVDTDDVNIIGFKEKPIIRSYVNAGVYVLEPTALSFLEKNSPCDMPTLFELLRANNCKTVAYPMHEPWLDVGRPSDFELVQTMGNVFNSI